MFDMDMLSRAQVVVSSPADLLLLASMSKYSSKRRQSLSITVVPSQAAMHLPSSHFIAGVAHETDRLC